jgi:MFS family permease
MQHPVPAPHKGYGNANSEARHVITMRTVVRKTVPQPVRDSLNYSWKEGVAAQVSISAFDYFLIPFAIFLGATAQQIGLLVAIPNFASSLSLLLAVRAVTIAGTRHKLLSYASGLQAVLIIPVIFLPFLPVSTAGKMAVLIFLISIFRVLGSLIGPAWGSLISEYLPEGQRVQYLGWRSRMVAISGIASTAFWGTLLFFIKSVSQSVGFVAIFTGVVLTRFLSFSLMSRMTDLPLTKEPAGASFSFGAFRERLRVSNFARFVYFVTTMTFATQLAAPYFSVYMLRNLQFDYISYTAVQLASVVASLVAFPIWGRNADVVGNARVLKSTSILIPFLPLLWVFARDPFTLILIELFSGLVWSGFNLCTSNFIYDAVAPEKRVRYLGYFNLINGGATFAGASLGGFMADKLPLLFGHSLLTLFLISSVLRFGASLFLSRHFQEVRETAKKVSSIDLYFSVLGIRPVVGDAHEPEVYPPIRPPREDFHKSAS